MARISIALFIALALVTFVVGKAAADRCSYYGEAFHGKLTANGERFNMNAMTAAHKTLKLGTWIRVTNTNNNKHVDVRINDRGPYVAGRVVDLAKGAFLKVESIGNGVFPCTFRVIQP